MKIIVERKYYKKNYIIGNLYICSDKEAGLPNPPPNRGELEGGLTFFCNTLEPPLGTATETITSGSRKAIAPGVYEIEMQWSPKFGMVLPCLQRVPGRSGILIHAGNYPRDTQGCILVGLNTKKGMVTQSVTMKNRLTAQIRQAIKNGEYVLIEIKYH